MRWYKELILLVLISATLWSQELGVDSTQMSQSLSDDSSATMLEVLRDDTLQDKDPLVYTIPVKDSVFIFNHGVSISLAWSFGRNDLINYWKRAQESYKDTIKQIFDTIADSSSRLQLVSLEEPTNQSISFPFSIGYLHRFNNRLALHGIATYSYQGKKSSFVMHEFLTAKDTAGHSYVTDTLELYRYKTHLQHHQAEISLSLEYLLIPDYFTVNNVSRIGVTAGASYIPLSLFISNALHESPVLQYNKSVYTTTRSMGVGWRFSIFGEKELSRTTAGRLSLGYKGTYNNQYEGYKDIAPILSDSSSLVAPSSTESTHAVSHQFELTFTLLIGKKVRVDTDEK